MFDIKINSSINLVNNSFIYQIGKVKAPREGRFVSCNVTGLIHVQNCTYTNYKIVVQFMLKSLSRAFHI